MYIASRIFCLLLICKTLKALIFYQLDLLVILESTSEIKAEQWFLQKQFINGIVSEFAKVGHCDVKVAVMNYGSKPEVSWNFKSPNAADIYTFLAALNEVPRVGGDSESMVPVIDMAINDVFKGKGERKRANNFVIMMKSRPSKSTEGLEEAAIRLHKEASVLVVGVTNQTDDKELMILARTQEKLATVNDFKKISIALHAAAPLVIDCHSRCKNGYTAQDVSEGKDFYSIILKDKKDSVPFNENDILFEGKYIDVSETNKICIKTSNGALFYAKTLCWNTMFVKMIKVKGVDENGETKLKNTFSPTRNGQGCKRFRKWKDGELKSLELLCIRFSPEDGHSATMKVGDIYLDGCAKD